MTNNNKNGMKQLTELCMHRIRHPHECADKELDGASWCPRHGFYSETFENIERIGVFTAEFKCPMCKYETRWE